MPDVAHYLAQDGFRPAQQRHPVAGEHGHGQSALDKIVQRLGLAAHLAAVLGEEAGQLADPDGVRPVHGLGPFGATAAEPDLAKQHVETDPGKRDGVDEGQPGQRDADGAPFHHHPQGDSRHDHGVK